VSNTKSLTPDAQKRAAAIAVLSHIKDGMKVGLGTGSTAEHFIRALAERVNLGLLRVDCVPTSKTTADLAQALGLNLVTLEDHPFIDITVDGADEIDPEFRLIKGGGGALLVEKIVASSSRFMVVIADESKRVKKLGKFPLPVEVVPFGVKATAWKLERAFGMVKMEAKMTLRVRDGVPFRTDSGNCIIDCVCGEINEPDRLEYLLNNIPGVVNNGLFIGICGIAFIGKADGTVEELKRA
jgi:ribose 5-phosphate isomerase A